MKRQSKATLVTAKISAAAMPASIAEPNSEISSSASPEPRVSRLDPWLLIVFVLTILAGMPFLHTVYGLGDEGVLLNGAERISHGETIYKDFFEFLPPGGFMLTVWWSAIAGMSVLSERIFGILIIAGTACFTYAATRHTTQDIPRSAMIAVLWAATSQGLFTELSHHWLTTLLSMMVFYFALATIRQQRRRPWLAFSAGATAAAAVMVTPTCGALTWLAGATFFLRQNMWERIAFLAASAMLSALLLAYLLLNDDLAWAYADTIGFTAGHYASIQAVPFGFLAYPQTYPLLCVFPITFLLTGIFCILTGMNWLTDRLLHLCLAFAVAGFVGCYPRPDIFHIAFAAPLALPLFAYCATKISRCCQPILLAIIRVSLIILCVPSALDYAFIANFALNQTMISTPRGTISLPGQDRTSGVLKRVISLSPDAKLFFYPYLPYMSFLTGREQVSKYDLFTPEYTLAAQYQDACLSVMQGADDVVFDQTWGNRAWVKAIFPAIRNPNPPEKQAFEKALDRGFDLVALDKPFELRHRNAAASPALCTGIAN